MAQQIRQTSMTAPLEIEPIFYNGLPTPEGSQAHSDLIDSPIEDDHKRLRDSKSPYDESRPTPIQKPSKPSPGAKKPKGSDSKNGAAFRFVVVDHPNQLRDRQEMRENRMHVMHDYLNKERRRPESRDTRVNGSARTNRRQKDLGVPNSTKTSPNAALPVNSFRVDVSRLTPPDSLGSDCSSDREGTENSAKRPAPASRSKTTASGEPAALIRRVYNPPVDDRTLVSGIGGRWQYSDYMKATPNDLPASPGSRVDPFYTLPPLIDPTLDVNSLKWSCSQRFGSDKLTAHWIPALLRARHAFLSTLCISSSHDAIMSRALAPPNVQSAAKSIQRWKVKRDVISLLTEAMKDPELQVADETMVSVVHLLVSDIMGCDDRDLKIHQDGLINMFTARGGLEKLGVGGELAAIMTIMNYLIAVLREIQPHHDYVKFATMITDLNPKPTDDSQPLPESPVYTGPKGFHTILRVVSPGSDIYELLSTVRALTNEFYLENGQVSTSTQYSAIAARYWNDPHETVSSLSRKVFAFQPARDKEFNDMNERYTYEAIRLTSLVYAHALANKIPISKAAEELSRRSPCTTSPGGRKLSDSGSAEKFPTMAMQIKYALVRTDISFCWDHMGGVLFWVALVGGAAANPGPFANEERRGEEEDARKFLAAIAVRCCVVLSFQYGPAIVETLKRLLMIETALAEPKAETMTAATAAGNGWAVPLSSPADRRTYGPAQASGVQKGFADFVQDFLNT